MRCISCSKQLSTTNYASVEGVYFCLNCFLEQHLNLGTTQVPCHACGTLPSSSSPQNVSVSRSSRPATSHAQRTKSSSTAPLNSNQSKNASESTIGKLFHQQRTYLPPRPPPAVVSDQRSHDEPEEQQHQTCQVCFEEKAPKHFRTQLSRRCGHIRRSICDTCVFRHIEQAFGKMCTDDVKCPEIDCGGQLSYETIKHILLKNGNKKLFERYDRFILQKQLEQMDEFIWCSNPNCHMGQLNNGGQNNNIVTCAKCHRKTCFTHKTEWHEGLTYQEYDEVTDGDLQASCRWIVQNSKKCPKCPFQIEKSDGCDHMTCIKCHHEFCWSCLADYARIRRDGNHRHDPNCKHYAAYDEK